jgi:hypothetical protein
MKAEQPRRGASSASPTLQSEGQAQLTELNLPQTHLDLIKDLVVLSRQEGRTRFGEDMTNAAAFTSPEEGAICIIPDLRPDLAHEIGHLVWRSLLTTDQTEDFTRIWQKVPGESAKLTTHAIAKHTLRFLRQNDPRSNLPEECFCWAYAYYLVLEDFDQGFPVFSRWLRRNVFPE